MHLLDYLNVLEKDEPIEPDFETEMIELAKKVHKFSDFNLLNQSKLDRVNKFIQDSVAEAKVNFHREYRCNRILQTRCLLERNLRYREPKLLNFELVEQLANFD